MLNKIFYYYKKEIKLLTYFLVSSFIVTALDLYGPILVQDLIDYSIPNKDIPKFLKYTSILLSVYLIRFLFSIFSSYKGQLMGNKIKYKMREDLFNKILSQSPKFFQEKQSGDIITRLTNDLENVSSLLYRGLEDFLFSVLSISGAIILMLNFNVKLAIITMLPLPFAIYFTIYQNKKLKIGYGEVRKKMSSLTSNIHSTLRVIFFIKDNALEDEKIKKFNKNNKKLLDIENKNVFNISSLISGINFYNQFTQLLVIFVGGYLHMRGEISFGIMVSFILLINRFRIYLLRLMSLVDTFQRGASGISRFIEITSMESPSTGSIILSKPIESISIKNLDFSYKGDQILKNLSLEVYKGQKIAFVGASGVGKTTLFSLLKKNLVPNNGNIFINGECLQTLNSNDYLARVGIVDQNEHLIDDTILENIKIINRDVSDEKLQQSLEFSYIKDLIQDLELKENTKLGENGINLSSGQKQRVALARLFLKSPDVILLDEATSALDNILESKIINNLNNEFKDKIIIAIAHRLNTLKNFDKIFVLGKDGILESGNFEELLDKKRFFYNMYTGINT
ncbi:MAG: ABC transporter ATP-binding protein [Cetobacterium sp.]|uniref:ABC transporter ATP-binding protein n=1 Tax=Cetobacterium sp. TaxID=2071632 RepID=UPI002FCBA465